MVPSGVISIDLGPMTGVPSNDASSGVLPRSPLPANVVIVPAFGSMRRTRLCAIQRNAVRLRQLSLIRWSAVAAVSAHACAGSRRNDFRLHINVADNVVVSFCHENVAFGIEADLVRRIHLGGGGGPSIARISGLSRPGDDRNGPGPEIKTHDTVASEIRPVKPPIRADDKPKRIVGGIACGPGPKERGDSR